MTWRAHISGGYHEIVNALRGLEVTEDNRAIEFGHVQAAKDAALGIIDSKKELDAAFSVTLGGHTSTKDSFSVSTLVTVTQNQPEKAD